ncbi:hypothetical protein DV735_g117, partial [Chaetothyriales sp. CBS 134920]
MSSIGKPITRQEIFTYSNGRFLVNEDKARSCRYVEFDLDQLCAAAAVATGQKTPVRHVEKMEGGYCKALLLHFEDGQQVVAKVQTPFAGPPKYTTAAEVAVLQFVKMYTHIPVPKVLGWSSDASNPVGAEYIFMEKAPGAQLFEKYGEMSELQKFTVLERLTELESELTKFRFPVYGSLYLRESMSPTDKFENLSQDLDPAQLFCIGPSCEREWHRQGKNLSSYGSAITSDEKITALRHAGEVFARLDAGTLLNKVGEPILWHHDIHMGNIYVSDEDPSKIVSLIDWQHVVIAPLFLQARFPGYLTLPDGFELDQKFPEPPEHYDQMSAEDKESADRELLNAKLAKGYEVACGANNGRAYKALFIPAFLTSIFPLSSEASENGVTSLIECLIEISNQWIDIGFADKTCPYQYDDRARAEQATRFKQYQQYNEIQQLARTLLDTDAEGWVAPQLDFAERQKANKVFLKHAMSVSSNYGMTPDEMRRAWPFPTDLEE